MWNRCVELRGTLTIKNTILRFSASPAAAAGAGETDIVALCALTKTNVNRIFKNCQFSEFILESLKKNSLFSRNSDFYCQASL